MTPWEGTGMKRDGTARDGASATTVMVRAPASVDSTVQPASTNRLYINFNITCYYFYKVYINFNITVYNLL